MQQVQRAALAPVDPSSQDRAIAARAAAQKIQAQSQAAAERSEELRETTGAPEDIIQPVNVIA